MALIETHLVLTDLIDELPPLNDTVLRLVGLTQDPHATADDVAQLLMRDGVLTGELLAEANSSVFASSSPARSVSDAVVRLGLMRVVAIATRLETARATHLLPDGAIDPRVIAMHHMHAVEAAVALGRRSSRIDRASAVTAAVLHDIGKLVLSKLYASTAILEDPTLTIGDQAARIELEMLDVNHGEVSRVVCEHWTIPDDIGEAIQHHHDPLGRGPLAAATYLADVVAHLAAGDIDEDNDFFMLVPPCLDELGLSHSDFNAVLKETRRAIGA
ncbi:MAG: HDOD domain-containing protein [Acidimicrobiales bacterium]